MNIKRIVVYVDLTPAAAAAVLAARRLAEAFDGELYLLRVVEDPLSAGWTAELSAAALPEVQDAMQAETEEWLSTVIEGPEGIEATLDMETGVAADEILKYAQRRSADLVVLGQQPSGDGPAAGQGAIIESVVADARVNVFVVRVPGGRSEPRAARDQAARNEADPAPDDQVSYDGPVPGQER